MKRFAACVAVLFALLAFPALAKEKIEPAVNANNKEAFATVSNWVRGQMDEGGRYGHVTAGERTRVNARLDEMSGLFERYGTVEQMPETDKVEMFNKQEEVNAILAKHDGERLICKNVKPVGSHIPVKQCMTAADMEARRRGDQHYLQKSQHTVQHKQGR
jgi:hypothetical protein